MNIMIGSQLKPIEKANMIPGQPSLSTSDRSKAWHMELFMERLRSRSSQLKSFQDTSKAVRMGLLDKRHSLDSVEKSQLQKTLDALQHEIKVTSLQGFVERLESLTRQLGLKFMVGPSGVELFISSEMFYLEILLESSGAVKDVKVNHDGKNSGTCEEFVRCLSQGDFNDFASQLEGLASLYQINAEKKLKAKAFVALQALETDLGLLYQLQNFPKNPVTIILRCSVGALQKRRGGHPMKLTYFISPYELINKDKKCFDPLTLENVLSKSLGHSVTVSIEGSTMHDLQVVSIVTQGRPPGTPSYAPLGPTTSVQLPAHFVLRLHQPMPLCVALATRLQQITGLEIGDLTTTHPILSLITQHVSKGSLDSASRGLFVSLPDQLHCYFMTERRGLDGILISRVPFTHPAHVPQALAILRQQALFNELITSCIRPNSKQDIESALMFELCPLTCQHISITLERPYNETVSTFEIDLSSISTMRCKLYSGGAKCTEALTDQLAKILQCCLSIPVTMRALLKLWQEEKYDHNNLNEMNGGNFSLGLGSDDPGGNNGGSNGGPNGGFNDHKLKLDSTMQQTMKQNAFMSSEHVSANENVGDLFPPVIDGDRTKRKRPASDDLWEVSPKRSASDCEILVESSSNDSASCDTRASMLSDGGLAERTPTSGTGFPSDLDLSVVDPSDIAGFSEKTNSDLDCSGDGVSLDDDAVEIVKAKKSKKLERKNSSLMMELSDKSFIPPSVSITPIQSSTNFNSVLSGMGLERRPGIEIIPIANSPAVSLPSSITITPISSSHGHIHEGERSKDRSSSNKSRSSEEKKKRRKRREDSNSPKMGPPGGKLDGSPSKPRSSEHSPSKHSSSSGKPSMSSMKSSSSSSSNKLKESSKIKSSSIKLKPLDISVETQPSGDECVISPSSSMSDSSKGQTQVQARNRKGSLSAVIDKLKSAQSSGAVDVDQRFQQSSIQGTGKNTEYMVKPSSDGMKITINKTRTGKPPSGSSSPKTHTGLKPGVNSGPASKKPQAYSNKTPMGGSSIVKSASASDIKSMSVSSSFSKTNSSSSLSLSNSTKSSKSIIGSPKSSSSSDSSMKSYNREKQRSTKSNDKSIFKSGESKRSSPAPSRDEPDNDRSMKLLGQSGLPPQLMVEGLIKSLDTKFQIPKLSQRIGEDGKKSSHIDKPSTPLLSLNELNDRSPLDINTKLFSDFMASKDLSGKYNHPSLKQLDNNPKLPKLPNCTNASVSLTLASSKSSSAIENMSYSKESSKMDSKGIEGRTNFLNSLHISPLSKDDSHIKDYCKPSNKLPSSYNTDFSMTKTPSDINKFTMNKNVDEGKRTPDALLDYSSNKNDSSGSGSMNMMNSAGSNRFSSPSVSLHFVKSPVPSPLLGLGGGTLTSSPHVENDELMDEALVGIGK